MTTVLLGVAVGCVVILIVNLLVLGRMYVRAVARLMEAQLDMVEAGNDRDNAVRGWNEATDVAEQWRVHAREIETELATKQVAYQELHHRWIAANRLNGAHPFDAVDFVTGDAPAAEPDRT